MLKNRIFDLFCCSVEKKNRMLKKEENEKNHIFDCSVEKKNNNKET